MAMTTRPSEMQRQDRSADNTFSHRNSAAAVNHLVVVLELVHEVRISKDLLRRVPVRFALRVLVPTRRLRNTVGAVRYYVHTTPMVPNQQR